MEYEYPTPGNDPIAVCAVRKDADGKERRTYLNTTPARKVEDYCICQGFDKSAQKAMRELVDNVEKVAREGYVPQGGVAVTLVNDGITYVQVMVKWVDDADRQRIAGKGA